MENKKSPFGLISLIAAIFGIIVAWFMSSTVGSIIYLIALAVAIFDLIKSFKGEGLTPRELLVVAGKENTISVITLFSIPVFIFAFCMSAANEALSVYY